jgi:ABC-type multidrug transport system ATPase subunit
MHEAPLLSTRGLTRRFGNIVAVDGLDLEVRRGEVFGLLGPNGAGKTTTLRMLLGLLPPTAGTISVAGHAPGSSKALTSVGALVEEPAHYPYLRGRDNLRVLARLAGVRETRVDEVLEIVELRERADHKVKTYSLGMRQRLGVAAALLKDPPLLLLDEPTNGLDPQGMAAMRAMLARLGTGDRAVLLSSHLLGEVQQICDRAAVIVRGRLVGYGPVSELRGAAGVRIRAEPEDEARTVCERFGSVTVEDGAGLTVTVEPERVPDLNAALVAAGVRVFELRIDRRSLEEAFLEITAGQTV